ncbi:MAG: helicase-related protein [candidate division WOR-3 bacterium]
MAETYGGKGSKGPNVFSRGPYNKGLQQYFTPPDIAEYIAKALDFGPDCFYIDPTCGDGALLAPFTTRGYKTYGIEIDPEMAQKAKRRASLITLADWCQVAKAVGMIMRETVPLIVVANPPYGLRFKVWPCDKVEDSDKAIALWVLIELLSLYASCFILPKNSRSARLLTDHCYAIIDIDDPWGIESHGGQLALYFAKSYNFTCRPEKRLTGHMNEVPPEKIRELIKPPTTFANNPLLIGDMLADLVKETSDSHIPKWKYENGMLRLMGSRLYYSGVLYDDDWNTLELLERGVLLERLVMSGSFMRTVSKFAQKIKLELPAEFWEDYTKRLKAYQAHSAPLQPLRSYQRLAFGIEAMSLKCIKDGEIEFKSAGETAQFRAGKFYLVVDGGTKLRTTDRIYHEINETTWRETWWTYMASYITLKDEQGKVFTFWDDNEEHLRFLVGDNDGQEGHFEFPYPGEAENLEKEKYESFLRKLETFPYPPGQELLRYQKEDIARLALRDQAILSWDTGLGKTRAIILWAWLKGVEKILIVSPARSIKNMAAEVEKGLGLKATILESYKDMEEAIASEKGIYLISYNKLAECQRIQYESTHIYDKERQESIPCFKLEITERGEVIETKYLSKEEFWQVMVQLIGHEDAKDTPEYNRMDYVKKWYKECGGYIYPVVKKLDGNFPAVILDEGHYIKGDSQRAEAVLRLKAPYRLIATATTIKNRIPDLFNLLFWLFEGNPAFPYRKQDRSVFVRDFALIKCVKTIKVVNDKEKSNIVYKVEGVRNLSVLWKMLTPFQIRRTKESLFEEYPEDYKRINGGKAIRLNINVYSWPATPEWAGIYLKLRDEFLTAFALKKARPDIANMPLMRAGGQDILGRLILIQQYCSYSGSEHLAYCPPKYDWRYPEDPQNPHEPKTRAVIARIIKALNEGRRVVLFSQFYATQDFYEIALKFRGIKVAKINGRQSKDQNEAIRIAFAAGHYDVMIAATNAAGLGLNGLERASVAIFVDLMWDPTTLRQAIGRIYRIGQRETPEVEIHLVKGTTEAHIWNIVYEKSCDVDMVLDGRLTEFTILDKGVIQRVHERTNETAPVVVKNGADIIIPELSILRPMTSENVIEPEPKPKPEVKTPATKFPSGPSLWGDGLMLIKHKRLRVIKQSLF